MGCLEGSRCSETDLELGTKLFSHLRSPYCFCVSHNPSRAAALNQGTLKHVCCSICCRPLCVAIVWPFSLWSIVWPFSLLFGPKSMGYKAAGSLRAMRHPSIRTTRRMAWISCIYLTWEVAASGSRKPCLSVIHFLTGQNTKNKHRYFAQKDRVLNYSETIYVLTYFSMSAEFAFLEPLM